MAHEIGTFMTWFVNKFIQLVQYCCSELYNIKIGNTNLLMIMISITIINLFLPVILSLNKGARSISEKVPKGDKKK